MSKGNLHRHPGHSQVESAPQAEAPSGTEVSPSPAVTPLPATHLLSLGGPLFTMFFCPLSSQPKTFLSPLFKGLYPGNPEKAIGKDSDAGRDWGQEEKGMTEDEMRSEEAHV